MTGHEQTGTEKGGGGGKERLQRRYLISGRVLTLSGSPEIRASSKERARRASFFTAQISRSWNVLSTFFVINAMQGPQRPRRASTQALAAMTTPERRNSFEAAQVFKATTRFVVVDS